mmetsp:Transcript_4501/g.14938  ORF Transcript_4501/g.14938 Transcript_4501/m.14938 type:complete len:273 (+) Transcript_4501:97-915(+)
MSNRHCTLIVHLARPFSAHEQLVEAERLEQRVVDLLVDGAARHHLRLVVAHRDYLPHSVVAHAQRAAARERVGRLDAAHVGPLLAQPLCAVLELAHAHPIAGADQVRHARLQRRPLVERSGREPGDGAGVAGDERVDDVRPREAGHGRGQQVLHQRGDDVLVRQTHERARVVKVACDHGALRLVAAPQRAQRLVAAAVRRALQLVEHEEGAARAAQRLEARKHVCGRARLDSGVEPEAAGYHVDAAERGRLAELRRRARQIGRAAHHAAHPL